MKIICDYDDILYPTVPTFLDIYEKETGHRVNIEEINGWDVSTVCHKYTKGVPQELFSEIDFLSISPIPETNKTLKLLNEMHEVLIVTANTIKQDRILSNKLAALNRDFPFIKDEQFIPTPWKYVFDADYIIEDSPKVAEMIYKRGKTKVLLMNKPWNQDCQFYHHRINNLSDVLAII